MTPTWAKHISYQIFAFFVSVAMIIGVADYAVTKSYSERKLTFVDNFTITAHTGAFNTPMNSLDSVQAAIDNGAEIIELDIRQRPNGTLVMSHDLVVTNNDATELKDAFELLAPTDILINLDIKETRTLNALYALLVEYNLVDRAFLTGIESINVKAVKESDCAGMQYYLNCMPSKIKVFSDDYRQKIITMLEEAGACGINCNYKYAGAQLSELLHQNGYKLSVWTIDNEQTAKKMLVISPDNITTKQPEMVKSVIENWGK